MSVLLTLFMVLMMLPTTAYADTAYCDICGKEVDIDYSNYEYLNAQFHQRSGYCQDCVLLLRSHALSIIGVERQLAQADRLAQFAVGHPIHVDMLTKAP